MNKFKCFACKKTITNHSTFTTGYGLDEDKHKICFSCCAVQDKEIMDMQGKISLYLCKKVGKYSVTNWPGTLSFDVREIKSGMHNLAKRRTDVWFIDHNNDKWHGVSFGNFTQVCHCKRIKDPELKFLRRIFRRAA